MSDDEYDADDMCGLTKEQIEICHARQSALGLKACEKCPIDCAVSCHNGNMFLNVVYGNPRAFPEYCDEKDIADYDELRKEMGLDD